MAEQDQDTDKDSNQDPQAAQAAQTIRELQAQLEAATGNVQAALATTRDTLRAANPNLPDTVFQAEDVNTLIANVEAHKATLAHAAEYAAAHKDDTPPAPTPAGAGTTRTVQVPDNLRGITRTAFALNNPGPGMTE